MSETGSANPYESPKSPNARLKFRLATYSIIIAVVVLTCTASAFMVARTWQPNKPAFLDRGPPVREQAVDRISPDLSRRPSFDVEQIATQQPAPSAP